MTLHNELPADLPPVIGDGPALSMLLSNLLTNAIKYNRPNGRVSVTAEADEQTVRLRVTDTGIGITPEHQAHVFEEFYRVKNKEASETVGTGMGLAICKRIAEELGGQITLESTAGVGTVFTVVLPRNTSDQAPAPQ